MLVFGAHRGSEFEREVAAAGGHLGTYAAGLDNDHLYTVRRDLAAEGVAGRFKGELGSRVGPEDGQRGHSPHGADIDDSAPAPPQEGQELLDDGDVPEEIHLELLAPQSKGEHLDGGVDLDPRVVDQDAQGSPLRVVGDPPGQGLHMVWDGDVQGDRFDAVGPDGIRLAVGAYPGEDVVSLRGEGTGCRGSDARRGAGDDDESIGLPRVFPLVFTRVLGWTDHEGGSFHETRVADVPKGKRVSVRSSDTSHSRRAAEPSRARADRPTGAGAPRMAQSRSGPAQLSPGRSAVAAYGVGRAPSSALWATSATRAFSTRKPR